MEFIPFNFGYNGSFSIGVLSYWSRLGAIKRITMTFGEKEKIERTHTNTQNKCMNFGLSKTQTGLDNESNKAHEIKLKNLYEMYFMSIYLIFKCIELWSIYLDAYISNAYRLILLPLSCSLYFFFSYWFSHFSSPLSFRSRSHTLSQCLS